MLDFDQIYKIYNIIYVKDWYEYFEFLYMKLISFWSLFLKSIIGISQKCIKKWLILILEF